MPFRKLTAQLVRLIKPDATDENWKFFGEKAAYFGVVSWPEFRPENLTEKSRADFFKTGESYVEHMTSVIRTTIEPDFRPQSALDFGCGVGRLVIPLSKRCGAITGVDVSPAMLDEARRNCIQQNISNAKFSGSLDELVVSAAKFDFVHSFIVFQHIRPRRGYELFEQIVKLLNPGGIGAVHFTYHNPGGKRDRLRHYLGRKIPFLWSLENLRNGRPFSEPMMDMAEYSLNRLFMILQQNECDISHTRFSKHGTLGILIFFKKAKAPEF